MPQLDKTTFFIQYIYLIIFFLVFYTSFEYFLLPTLYKVLKVRKYYFYTLKDNILFLVRQSNNFYKIKNNKINYLFKFLFISTNKWLIKLRSNFFFIFKLQLDLKSNILIYLQQPLIFLINNFKKNEEGNK